MPAFLPAEKPVTAEIRPAGFAKRTPSGASASVARRAGRTYHQPRRLNHTSGKMVARRMLPSASG